MHHVSVAKRTLVRRYQQKYSKEPLPDDWLKALRNPGTAEELRVPEVNPFTPTDLALLNAADHEHSGDKDVPVCVADDEMVRM